MIDFRAICLVLFPETVLQETPWEWDTLHQQLPLGETHCEYRCSVLRQGSASMLRLAGFHLDYSKNTTQKNKLQNALLLQQWQINKSEMSED